MRFEQCAPTRITQLDRSPRRVDDVGEQYSREYLSVRVAWCAPVRNVSTSSRTTSVSPSASP